MPAPRPDLKMVQKVRNLKELGLSISEIARTVKKDRQQVRRWLTYEVGQDIHTPDI